MPHITFFTKIGCTTSAKQIALLESAGHSVEALDLLAHQWNAEELASYFGDLPVNEWFNEKSPRVKSGEINPGTFDRDTALAVMLEDHLLIHRPLMESGGVRVCGFDLAVINSWLGLGGNLFDRCVSEDFTGCSQMESIPRNCP